MLACLPNGWAAQRTSSRCGRNGRYFRATACASNGACWRQDMGMPGKRTKFPLIGAHGRPETAFGRWMVFWTGRSREAHPVTGCGASERFLDRPEPPPDRTARSAFGILRASAANPIVATKAQIDRPVDKRRASAPAPAPAPLGPEGASKGRFGLSARWPLRQMIPPQDIAAIKRRGREMLEACRRQRQA
jgi:hypothetical protein